MVIKLIWLILLAVGILLGVDGYVFYHMRFLLCTALMAFIYFAMVIVIIRIFTPAIIFGEGLCALLCSYFLSNILQLCEEKTEEIQENIRNGGKIENSENLENVRNSSSAQETFRRDENSWSIRDVQGKAKIEYIWEYYKLPIIIAGIFVYIAGYMVYGYLVHKETILYTALANVAAGDTFTEELSTDFLHYLGANDRKEEVELYTGLYFATEPSGADLEYVYASNTKITALIAGEQLDVVLMDKEAFDLFSRRGYLCNIEQLLIQDAPDLYEEVQPQLVVNTVVLEDNAVDVQLDPSIEYEAVTDEYPMAMDLSQAEMVAKEGLNGTLYLGIISNAKRVDTAVSYLRYLMGKGPLE